MGINSQLAHRGLDGPLRLNPIGGDPASEGSITNGTSGIVGPFCNWLGFAKRRCHHVVATVSILLFACSESAIARGVAKVVLPAVNLKVAGIPVGKSPSLERRVVINPFWAYIDSTPTIPRIWGTTGVTAPLLHALPDPVKASVYHLDLTDTGFVAGVNVAFMAAILPFFHTAKVVLFKSFGYDLGTTVGAESFPYFGAGLLERHLFLQRTSPGVVGDHGAGDTIFRLGNYASPDPYWSVTRASGNCNAPSVGKGRS
jgi:hypothetical protein